MATDKLRRKIFFIDRDEQNYSWIFLKKEFLFFSHFLSIVSFEFDGMATDKLFPICKNKQNYSLIPAKKEFLFFFPLNSTSSIDEMNVEFFNGQAD